MNEIKLPPLPEGYTLTKPWDYEGQMFTEGQMKAYATAAIEPYTKRIAELQSALQSPEVQALRKDAERYKELRAMATQQANTLGPIFRIDVQRTPKTMFNFDAAVDLAMEKQK